MPHCKNWLVFHRNDSARTLVSLYLNDKLWVLSTKLLTRKLGELKKKGVLHDYVVVEMDNKTILRLLNQIGSFLNEVDRLAYWSRWSEVHACVKLASRLARHSDRIDRLS